MGEEIGKRPILAGRTAEGSAGFLAASLIAGYAVSRILGAPILAVVAAGSVTATIIELISVGIDDNLTVALGSAGVMAVLTGLMVPA